MSSKTDFLRRIVLLMNVSFTSHDVRTFRQLVLEARENLRKNKEHEIHSEKDKVFYSVRSIGVLGLTI